MQLDEIISQLNLSVSEESSLVTSQALTNLDNYYCVVGGCDLLSFCGRNSVMIHVFRRMNVVLCMSIFRIDIRI